MRRLFLFIIGLLTSSSGIAQVSIYDIQLHDINGKIIDLNRFKGRYIMFVNVASECGFTSQYSSLEELYQKYKKDLVVIGVPCNQFGGQEPGSSNEIQEFCSVNYGITFILTQKIKVKGKGKHPLYKWLTEKKMNGKFSSSVKWNFQKYVINTKGDLINYFYSTTQPMSRKITAIFEQ